MLINSNNTSGAFLDASSITHPKYLGTIIFLKGVAADNSDTLVPFAIPPAVKGLMLQPTEDVYLTVAHEVGVDATPEEGVYILAYERLTFTPSPADINISVMGARKDGVFKVWVLE